MLAKISENDLEQLSAYLDGELDHSNLANMEARLIAESDLRLALEELRGLKAALRKLPRAKVPRHFTLGAAHQRVSWLQRMGITNSWGMISAAATLMLALVFAGELLAFTDPLAGGESLALDSVAVAQDEAPAEIAPANESAVNSAPAADESAMSAEMVPNDEDADVASDEGGDFQAEAIEIPETQKLSGADDTPESMELEEATERNLDSELESPADVPMLNYLRRIELGLAAIALLSLWISRRHD